MQKAEAARKPTNIENPHIEEIYSDDISIWSEKIQTCETKKISLTEA